MRSILTVGDPSVDPALESEVQQPDWLHSRYQIPPGKGALATWQRNLLSAGRATSPRTGDIFTVDYVDMVGRLQSTGSPEDGWPSRSRIAVPELVLVSVAVGAATVLASGRGGSTVGWPRTDRFVLDVEEGLVDRRLRKLFHDACDETFEDGMASAFSASLIHMVQVYGVAAVRTLEKMVREDGTNVEVVEELLRQMGHMDDSKTSRQRLSLLENALTSPNPRIRDAALIGIEAMDDPAAIKSLQRAIASERHGRLRQNIRNVMAHLRDCE